MRAVASLPYLEDAWTRCASEARAAFGQDALYVEELLDQARHVEVQIVGDGSGAVSHIGERECSIQRRRQKLVEVAPSPHPSPALRAAITGATARMAEAVRYRGLGTFEFLVNDDRFVFIEANPR